MSLVRLRRFCVEESGQEMVEYALMVAVVAVSAGVMIPPTIGASVSTILSKAISVLGRFN